MVIKVQTLPNSVFERAGNDLKSTVKISLKQALLGFEKELTQLDGRVIKINRKGKITMAGEV